jgi:hypothetical protein
MHESKRAGLQSRLETDIILCDCRLGKEKAPLAILGLTDYRCKHARFVAALADVRWRNLSEDELKALDLV